MKLKIFSLLAISLLLLGAGAVSAQEGSTSTGTTPTKTQRIRDQIKTERDARKQALEEAKQARGANQLEAAKRLAEKLINERVRLLERLTSAEHTRKCGDVARAEAQAVITDTVTRLNSLSVTDKTTVAEVRALIHDDIVGKNHVYVALLPAVRGMCVADKIINLIDGKLSEIVERLKTAGQDTTELEAILDNAKLSAQATYDAYKAIAGNPGSSTLRSDLSAAKDQLKETKSYLQQAREAIGKLKDSFDEEDDSVTPLSN